MVTNWAGNIEFETSVLHRPTSADEVQQLVKAGGPLRVLGSGHSFNRMADTAGALLTLADFPRLVEISADRTSVRVDGGIKYGELAAALHKEGLAVHNMASLPHISVAGAIATGTHGSGPRNGNLATGVSSIELIRGDGTPVVLRRGDAGFDGAVVGLGALGVVTALTLDVVPSFDIRQYVYDDVPRSSIDSSLAEMMADGYSVSLFTQWNGIFQAWLKRPAADPAPAADWFGAHPADGPRHPVPGMPGETSTEQGGVPGPWHLRLPHFRMEFTPSNGDELQSEYHVAFADAADAIESVAEMHASLAPVLQVCELRTIAADSLWLSPNYQRDSLALHFTWIADTAAVLPVLGELEARLAPLDARPHWGKVFRTSPSALRTLFPRLSEFSALVDAYDPAGTFRNPWLEAVLG